VLVFDGFNRVSRVFPAQKFAFFPRPPTGKISPDCKKNRNKINGLRCAHLYHRSTMVLRSFYHRRANLVDFIGFSSLIFSGNFCKPIFPLKKNQADLPPKKSKSSKINRLASRNACAHTVVLRSWYAGNTVVLRP
jgi:hypothetical protein